MKRIALLTILLLGLIAQVSADTTIGEARGLPDTTPVSVSGSVIFLQPNECYIESTDRISGIWTQPLNVAGVAVGGLVAVSGVLATINGEKTISGATLSGPEAGPTISPFGLRNSWLGGLCQADGSSLQDYVTYRLPEGGIGRRWQLAMGAPTTGVLVKTWGTVRGIYYSPITESPWFYIDDGSVAASDCGDQGIIVYSDASVSEGDFVAVTGVSSIEVSLDDTTKLVRSIRPRSSADIAILRRAPVCFPYSDEFDLPLLDGRWAVLNPQVGITLAPDSGWLALPVNETTRHSPSLVQSIAQNLIVDGDNWDMEIKIQPRFDTADSSSEYFYIGPASNLRNDNSQDLWIATFSKISNPEYGGNVRFLGASTVVEGGTYWLRYRQRGTQLYGSVSSDGTNYSNEVTRSIMGQQSPLPVYFRAWAAVPQGASLFSPRIDYVRFTRVNP